MRRSLHKLLGEGKNMGLFNKEQKARFWGYGDRMVCVAGIKGEGDEFNVTSHSKLHDGGYVATFLISTGKPHEALHIHAFYDGYWSFAVSPADIDFETPPTWPVSRAWGTVNEHSETIEIQVPNDARLSVIDRFTGPV